MAKKIIRLPGHMSRSLLRLASAGVAFLFTLFIYASGQVTQATSQGKTALAKAGSGNSLQSLDSIMPAYGVIGPLYGIIGEYGMPYAEFSVKGTIRSSFDGAKLEGVEVIVKDTVTKQTMDSSFTTTDGSFLVSFRQTPKIAAPALNTWVLQVRDIDGAHNGSFANKDTLISIPTDSLKGGSGFLIGADTVNVELYLQKIPVSVIPTVNGASQARLSVLAWRGVNAAIETRYSLPVAALTRIALYSATGRLLRDIFERVESAGDHAANIETSGLSAGTYFLKLQSGAYDAITRIVVER
jgi:putative lipoprotein (rSAM/lipoprotein system)